MSYASCSWCLRTFFREGIVNEIQHCGRCTYTRKREGSHIAKVFYTGIHPNSNWYVKFGFFTVGVVISIIVILFGFWLMVLGIAFLAGAKCGI